MDLRLALYELAAQHQLNTHDTQRLQHIAGLDREPPALGYRMSRGVAVLSAALGGFGIILWIAANWDTFGRMGRFALLQIFFVVMCLGAIWRPAARTPLSLIALLAIGALFAHFGQTYQTGADPWQLFGVWAVLGLPLCLSARSDVLWTPWVVVVIAAISLWVHAHTGYRWRVETHNLTPYMIGWSSALALTFALSPVGRRFSGADLWALRTAFTLATVMIAATALGGLFNYEVAPHYWLGLTMLVTTAAMLATSQLYELYGASIVSLAMNTLVVAGVARALFDRSSGDIAGKLLVLGLVAGGLLAVSVVGVLYLSRRHDLGEKA